MINLLAVIIGLFILVAIAQNKDFRKPKNGETYAFLLILVLILVLVGLGALLPLFGAMARSQSMLMFFLLGLGAVTVSTSGQAKTFSRVAFVAVLAFIIMSVLVPGLGHY